MTILRRWIIWSTLLGCFSEGMSFYIGSVHFLYFYAIILLNLLLLFLLQFIWIPPGLIVLLCFTAFSGMAGILQGTDTVPLFLKSEIGIVLCAIYACAFLRFVRFDALMGFHRYAKTAYFVAIFGLFVYCVQISIGNFNYRLKIFAGEPSEFSIVTLPALYYFADRWHRHSKDALPACVLLAAILLSRSSAGFMGIFVGLYLFGTRFRFGSVYAPFVIVLLGSAAYTLSPDFQLRLGDSVSGVALQDSSTLNDSSFSLLSGAFVAGKTLLAHPLIGAGLGGTPMASDRYIGDLPGISLVPEEMWAIARGDAFCMLSRLATETGLAGLFLAFGFLVLCYPRGASVERKQVANGLLVYAFVKFLRSGVYFNPEVFLLLTIYAVNGSALLHRSRHTLIGSTASKSNTGN